MFLFEMFVGLSLWFWLFPVVLLIGAFFLEDEPDGEFPFTPFILTALSIGAVWWFHGLNFSFDWGTLVVYSLCYLGIGLLWSFFKWIRLLVKMRDMVLERLPALKLKYKGDFAELRDRLKTYIGSEFIDDNDIFPDGIHPKITSGKNYCRIRNWIIYWPFSVVNYILGKLLVELVDFVINQMKAIYKAIARYIFRGISLKD